MEVSLLPAATESVTSASEPFVVSVDVDWDCDDYDSGKFGEYVFTAVLPPEWSLDDGVVLPQITVALLLPISPMAAGDFTVSYTNAGGTTVYSYPTTWATAISTINGLPADATDIVLTINNPTSPDVVSLPASMPSKPFTLDGRGAVLIKSDLPPILTINSDITFKDVTIQYTSAGTLLIIDVKNNNITLDNAHLVATLDKAKSLHVASPSSINIPGKTDQYYVEFSGYDKNAPPLTGSTLTLLADGATAPSGYLMQFLSELVDSESIAAKMIPIIKLGSGYDPSMLARWTVITPTTYRFDLYAPPVMVSYKKDSLPYIEYFDIFNDSVSFVNGLDSSVTDIVISLRKDGLSSSDGNLPNKPCEINSDLYDSGTKYTLDATPADGFKLNNNLALRDVGFTKKIDCNGNTLSIYDGVTLSGNIEGSGALEVYGTVAVPNISGIEAVTVSSTAGTTPELTVTTSLDCGNLTVNSDSSVTAGTVNCGGTLTLANSSSVITANCVDANTLVSYGGEIKYSGSGAYSAAYILNLANFPFSGDLNISAPDITSFSLSPPSRIIKVPHDSDNPEACDNITLNGSIFKRYSLELSSNPDGDGFDYYVLKPVVASVTYGGVTKKYTTLDAAFDHVDSLAVTPSGEWPVLNLWTNVSLPASGDIPAGANPCVIDGREWDDPDESGTPSVINTLETTAASITINRDIKFRNIELKMTGAGDYTLAAGSHALTIDENVSFNTPASTDITGTGSLTVNGNLTCRNITGFGSAAFTGGTVACGDIAGSGGLAIINITSGNVTCGTISGFGDVKLSASTVACSGNITGSGAVSGDITITGGDVTCGTIGGFADIIFNGAAVTLGQLVVTGGLNVTANPTLTFTSSSSSSANIIFADGHDPDDIVFSSGGLTVDCIATVVPSIDDRLIRIPRYSEDDFIAYKSQIADKITLGTAYLKGPVGDEYYMTLRPKADSGAGYFILSEPVGKVDLTSSPSGSPLIVEYGSSLTITAQLKTYDGLSDITGWLTGEAEVEFWLGDGLGNAVDPIEDAPVNSGGTAELTVTNDIYRSYLKESRQPRNCRRVPQPTRRRGGKRPHIYNCNAKRIKPYYLAHCF